MPPKADDPQGPTPFAAVKAKTLGNLIATSAYIEPVISTLPVWAWVKGSIIRSAANSLVPGPHVARQQ